MVHVATSQQDTAPPPYTTPPADGSPIDLSIISSPDGKKFLITLQPPQEPTPSRDDPNKPGRRAPVDIVLVIDVSGSMDDKAPAPGDDEPVDLTVLDVVKHSVRTIVTSMGGDDRVSVVTFSTTAKLVVPLTRTDEGGKVRVMGIVERLRAESRTNIWDGLKTGMNVLTSQAGGGDLSREAPSGLPTGLPSERLSSIFLLTDGKPNVEPPRGHIPMLKLYLESCSPEAARFTINTFGFGYGLDSQLLSDIAAVGKGAYGFIPDSGMVGTVFVHAAANTYATFCDTCELSIEPEDNALIKDLEVLGGLELVKASWGVRVDLGAVQYGQTKDVVARIPAGLGKGSLTVTAKYRPWSSPPNSPDVSTTRAIHAGFFPSSLDPNLTYHTHRATFVQEIFALFTGATARRAAAPRISPHAIQRLTTLAKTIQNDMGTVDLDKPPRSDALALAEDIEGEAIMALNGQADKGAFDKWGRHYLPSLARSHQRQQCSNFKDESLQVYGRSSPLFVKSRNEMDSLFDNLPPPTPSYEVRPPRLNPPGGIYIPPPRPITQQMFGRAPIPRVSPVVGMALMPEMSATASSWMPTSSYSPSKSMSYYNKKSAPCFAGHCLIALATLDTSGSVVVRVDALRRGMKLQTPAGPRSVAAVVRTTAVNGEFDLCSIGRGGLLITPWHPIQTRDGWEFPIDISPSRKVACEAVYSILLQPDQNSDAHSVWIGGVLCVTLGHGVVQWSEDHHDVRAHIFLGDYGEVVASMVENPAFFDEEGVLEAYGTLRSEKSDLVCGFSWKEDDKWTSKTREAEGLKGLRSVALV